MQITCKCLNVLINSRGSLIDNYDFQNKGSSVDHLFFKENIGCVELESIHKQQSSLVEIQKCGEWVIHRCLNCDLFTHAFTISSTAIILINRALLTKPTEIAALKNSEQFSPVFHIIINNNEDDGSAPISGVRSIHGTAALNQKLTEWIQRETSQTEEKVRQYSEQQYAVLDQQRTRAHRDHTTLTRILVNASIVQKSSINCTSAKTTVQQFSSGIPPKVIPILPDPSSAISKKPTEVANKPKNLARKPSVDAEGLFDLDGMDELLETFPSDEELEHSDTDDSGSHDEGIHIPRHVSSVVYAKSLPVNVPFMGVNSEESPHGHDYRVPQEPMDIAASIKALAKSVHGDAVFGDLPRPRFSSQI